MQRLKFVMPLAALLLVAACGAPSEQAAPAQTSPAAPVSSADGRNLDIAFKSEPTPVKMGENQFEVLVKGADGVPVTDADVSLAFFMAAMPAMNMAEMRNTVPLAHDANGVYRGRGNVMMAGSWEMTVMVMRGGRELGSRKITVTVQ